MTNAAAIVPHDSDDISSPLAGLLGARQHMLNTALTVLLNARGTPQAFPLAINCMALCAISLQQVANRLGTTPLSLESMLRMDANPALLRGQFTDAVLELIEENAPYIPRTLSSLPN